MDHARPASQPPLALHLRSPAEVMRLERMGSAHPTRLSFLRSLLRRVERESWCFDRPVWEIDDKGVGCAVYRAAGPERSYCLVAFAHDLPAEMRSDRVIATGWDATFTLYDGVPTTAELDRLQANVPLQEGGRLSPRELSLSRANRSVRLFSHVVERLAAGRQPDAAELEAVGYLMRTTAVYGSGKFGAADRATIAGRPELSAPFQAEMLSVWLTRAFTVDIVEHLARVRGGADAVRLDPAMKRGLGVGNSTGLGMAPFLVRHPVLLNNWMLARETALARVRAQNNATPEAVALLKASLDQARRNAALWRSEHPIQIRKLRDLRADLDRMAAHLADWSASDAPDPWDALWRWGEAELSIEGQEALLALMLEPHDDLVDDLADAMAACEGDAFRLDGAMSVGRLRSILADHYDWALSIDFAQPRNAARFWYVSEEKLEPRLGDRHTDPGAELEQPLCIARLTAELDAALAERPDDEPIAAFLLACPEHRYMARRAQMVACYPYAEVHDNIIAEDMLPIDLMRCKLAFFGASRFDPRSDKWVRISLFQDQPYPSDLMPDGDVMITEPNDPTRSGAPVPANAACLSQSEVASLCLKAARGAGMSWGMAEEAGFAAAWLAARGIDGPGILLAQLRSALGRQWADICPVVQDGVWHAANGGRLCPVTLGAALCDFVALPQGVMAQAPLQVGPVDHATLLLPFLATLAGTHRASVVLHWPGGEVVVGPDDRVSGDIDALRQSGAVSAKLSLRPAAAPHPVTNPARLEISALTLGELNDLALKTTVPASEASRVGAGAASSDND